MPSLRLSSRYASDLIRRIVILPYPPGAIDDLSHMIQKLKYYILTETKVFFLFLQSHLARLAYHSGTVLWCVDSTVDC